jgi:hypothetical protein
VSDHSDSAAGDQPGQRGAPAARAEPDVEQLAERVYQLLLAELRLDVARRGGRATAG